MHFDLEVDQKREEDEKLEHIKSLVQGFFGAPSSANCSINGYNINVLESWFTELGVGWILDVTSGASAGEREHTSTYTYDTQSWIRALAEITETIRLASASVFPDRGSLGLPSISEDKEEPEAESGSKPSPPDQFQDAQFIHETMSETLAYVDVVVAPNATAKATIKQIEVVTPMDRGGTQQYGQLSTLLGVHDALSRALAKIRLSFHSSSTAQVQRIQDETVHLLSAREARPGWVRRYGAQ